MTKDICEYSLIELNTVFSEIGEPKFRAKQVYEWLHKKHVSSFDEMTNISVSLRRLLSDNYHITVMNKVEKLESELDGTRKYVFALYDDNVIESVFMRYKHGNSVCISSQVGCAMGCRFCASTLEGCVRNLTAAEMLAEVYRIEEDTKERVSNVVIMGSGEPLVNYDEVIKFIRMLSDENGINISARNITLSTCGIVPGIIKLSEEGLPVTLALSLHAPTEELRREMMPITNTYHLKDVLDACNHYFEKTGRRLSFEYAVVRGVNDNKEEAEKLAHLIKHMHGHVNLIPVNPIKEREYKSPDKEGLLLFKSVLEEKGINVTVRREMGRDISSACGQLRRRHLNHAGTGTN